MPRTTTMTLRLSGPLSEFVAANVGEDGAYENVSEDIRDLIRSSRKAPALHGWLARLRERKKPKVAAVALANKIARIARAVLWRNTTYQANPA